MNTMNEYMAEIVLPIPPDSEFISLIPKHRELINRLISEGVISDYSVSIDEGKLWATIIAESEEKADDIINKFPIRHFIKYKLSKLAFHINAGYTMPQFSLN